MHCYRYLAAVAALADSVEASPEIGRRLPLSVLADWMDENGIEPDDVLAVTGDEVRAIVESVIQRDQPDLPHAA